MPGERALKVRDQQVADGVGLHPEILPSLEPWAKRFGVAPPEPGVPLL
jgi:hypothetical protein